MFYFWVTKKGSSYSKPYSYIALGIGAAFMGYMGWYTLDRALRLDQFLRVRYWVPLWIPQSLWMTGLIIFGLSALWTAFRGVLALRIGLKEAEDVLAPPTISEEMKRSVDRSYRSCFWFL